jgi:hypothetical protein
VPVAGETDNAVAAIQLLETDADKLLAALVPHELDAVTEIVPVLFPEVTVIVAPSGDVFVIAQPFPDIDQL